MGDKLALVVSDRLSVARKDGRLDRVAVGKLDELGVALLGSLLTVTGFVLE